jgi:uncharacterized protein YbjQ (UPF0145 family)
MGGCESVDVSVDPEQAAKGRPKDPVETENLDIYVSTLGSPMVAGLVVVKEFGLVTGSFVKSKCGTFQSPQEWVNSNALEAEKARSVAVGNVRKKAKEAGANAVIGLKIDVESTTRGQGSEWSMTYVVATGTAVLLSDQTIQSHVSLAQALTSQPLY